MMLIGRENNDDEVKREQGTTHDFLEIVLFCLASPSSYNLVHFFILSRAQPTPINPYVHVSYVGIHTSCIGKEKREHKKKRMKNEDGVQKRINALSSIFPPHAVSPPLNWPAVSPPFVLFSLLSFSVEKWCR